MTKNEKGITMKQVVAIFILSTAAPVVRLIPGFVAEVSGAASWAFFPITLFFGIVIIGVLNKLMNGFKDKNGNKIKIQNLNEAYSLVYGRKAGKILSVVYIIWLLLCLAVQVRLFAERFATTLLIYAPLDFFIISMLVIVYVMNNIRIEAFGRFSQLFSIVFLIVMGIVTLIIIKEVDINNLLPITTYDIKGVLLSGLEITGLCVFFTYSFFFGEKITDKENINKNKKYAVLSAIYIVMIVIITTIGVFGHKVTAEFIQPFLATLKYINIFNSVERIESILVALWVIADVTLICFLLLCTSNLCKNTFKLSNRRTAVVPMLLVLYGIILLIGKSYIYLLDFATIVIFPLNLLFGLIIPLITIPIAKSRKLM